MRCIQFQLRKKFSSDVGNATLGFAIVAPLLAAVFIVVLQLIAITRERAALVGIAHEVSRVASAADGTSGQGMNSARMLLGSSSQMRAQATIKVQRLRSGGVHYVQTTVMEIYRVPWLAKSVTLTARVRSLDESSL